MCYYVDISIIVKIMACKSIQYNIINNCNKEMIVNCEDRFQQHKLTVISF